MSYRRIPPNTEGMVSLKVDNLTYRTTPETLKRVFEKYGDVGDVYIPRDPYTQDSRGFAFVRYFDERDADDAIERLNGALLDGRELRVQLAKHARPPQSSSYSRRYEPPPRRSRRRYHFTGSVYTAP